MANKRYSESEFNAMDNPTLIRVVDAYTNKSPDYEFRDWVPAKVKVRYFVSKYGSDLSKAIKGTGILFSTAVAQNALESSYGKSDLAFYHNNFGGIKATLGYPTIKMDTSEYIKGKRVNVKQSFTKFPTPKASFDYYVSIVKKVAPSIATLNSAEEQIKLIAKGDGAYMNTTTRKPIGYTTTPPDKYLYELQGILNRTRDMYQVGKIA